MSKENNEKFGSHVVADSHERTKEEHKYVAFTKEERYNIIFYILGIMCFKFAFETIGNAVSLIAQDRFSKEIRLTMTPVLQSLFNVAQILCSIAGAQLTTRFRTSHLLAASMFSFAALVLILIIINGATGGQFSETSYGNWNPWLIYPIYIPMGGCLGVLELLRRVIPRDIVGENPNKLKRMDSMVHIFYEVAGTAGAFASSATIKSLGPTYATIIMPILFTMAGILWLRIRSTNEAFEIKNNKVEGPKRKNFFYLYYRSMVRGAVIVFSERRFIWLLPGYVLPLFFHRFIENVLFPTFAKQVLFAGHLAPILLAGSNLGELFGAVLVYFTASKIYTPLPWVRLDGIALAVLWVFPYLPVAPGEGVKWVWSVFPLMMFLSGGWAAGDVSLLAYIQSRLHHLHVKEEEGISPLGCVMAFLYSSYIAMFAVTSIPLGKVFDQYNVEGRVREAFVYIAGVMFLVGGVIIFLCTFIPKGSFGFNPNISDDDQLASNEEDDGKGPTLVEAISGA